MTDKHATLRNHLKNGEFLFGATCCGIPEYSDPNNPPECCGRPVYHEERIADLLAERDRLLEALINLHGVADVHDQSGMRALQDAGDAIREAMRVE